MGLFDSLMVPCPTCGTRSEFQSKSGQCTMRVINWEDCDDETLLDAQRHSPNQCAQCGTWYDVEVKMTCEKRVVVVPKSEMVARRMGMDDEAAED